MTGGRKILFVDDELFFAQPYVESLENDFTVAVRTGALEATEEIRLRANDYVGVVLDVMLPPPAGWESRTKDGIDTGIEILRQCSQEIVAARLPVVVLTHRNSSYTQAEVKGVGFPDGLVEVHSKLETPPLHLAVVLKRLATKWKGDNQH